jgi:3-phenylpropionate/cinnamic acid dioxygenase small subunit
MEVSESDRLEVINMVERPPKTAEERITRLADKEAILDILMRYSHYCDTAQWDSVLDLYTDDVERVLTGTLEERVRGKEVLRKLYLQPVLPRKADGKPSGQTSGLKIRHFIGTPIVRLSEDGREAFLTSYFTLFASKETPEAFLRSGHEGTYIFSFVKQGEAWKIRKMVVETEIAHDPLFKPAS